MVERGEPGRGAGGDVDRGLGVGGKVVLMKGRSVCIPVVPGCLSCPLFRLAGETARGERRPWAGCSCSVSRRGVHTYEPVPVQRGLLVGPALLGVVRAPSRLSGMKGRVVRPLLGVCPRGGQPWGTRYVVGARCLVS
jgi:hypothetical protein